MPPSGYRRSLRRQTIIPSTASRPARDGRRPVRPGVDYLRLDCFCAGTVPAKRHADAYPIEAACGGLHAV